MKITRVAIIGSEWALKFANDQLRTQFYESATPGVTFAQDGPYILISLKGETQAVPFNVCKLTVEEVKKNAGQFQPKAKPLA